MYYVSLLVNRSRTISNRRERGRESLEQVCKNTFDGCFFVYGKVSENRYCIGIYKLINRMAVYLIGWPPKCGKTTLAKTLSKKLSIPWISADTLQNIVYAYTSKEDHRDLFPNSYLRWETNDGKYDKYSSKEIIDAYIGQGKTSYKAISMMAETSIVDGDDYIIEWYQVTPEVAKEIIEKFDQHSINVIFLYKTDEKKFIDDIHKSTTPNDWIIRRTEKDSTFVKIAKMVSEYWEYFSTEANKYWFESLNMDQGFEQKIQVAIKSLTVK